MNNENIKFKDITLGNELSTYIKTLEYSTIVGTGNTSLAPTDMIPEQDIEGRYTSYSNKLMLFDVISSDISIILSDYDSNSINKNKNYRSIITTSTSPIEITFLYSDGNILESFITLKTVSLTENIKYLVEVKYGYVFITLLATLASPVDPLTIPLTFTAVDPGAIIKLLNVNGTYKYSIDDGVNWPNYDLSSEIPLANAGDKVMFKARTTNATTYKNSFTTKFTITGGRIAASGNIQSLLKADDFDTKPDVAANCYRYLFKSCTLLTRAPLLPATILGNSCYAEMFHGCTSLTHAPELPATILTDYCYLNMLSGCTSLTHVPAILPAETLTYLCYSNMFSYCTSLTQAPALPATTIYTNCYAGMLSSCTSLTSAPALPAAILSSGCYRDMFNGCTSLSTAPVLSSTSLAGSCYLQMFKNCSSLLSAPELPATILYDSCYATMFQDCSSLTKPPVLPASTLAWACYSNLFLRCTSLSEAPVLSATVPSHALHCYEDMFHTCTSLSVAPILSSTTLANYCYQSMFSDCTSLTQAPTLPAATLANYCYAFMFDNCASLVEAPVLSSTTLANNCYELMFSDCSSLISAPALPAEILANSCYAYMFEKCASLAVAPVLPATTLVYNCYDTMFYNCTKLNTMSVNFTDWSESLFATNNWMLNAGSDVVGTKTLSCPDALPVITTNNVTLGDPNIPNGWTIATPLGPVRALKFTGTQSGDLGDFRNYDQGVLPTARDTVLVDETCVNMPTTGSLTCSVLTVQNNGTVPSVIEVAFGNYGDGCPISVTGLVEFRCLNASFASANNANLSVVNFYDDSYNLWGDVALGNFYNRSHNDDTIVVGNFYDTSYNIYNVTTGTYRNSSSNKWYTVNGTFYPTYSGLPGLPGMPGFGSWTYPTNENIVDNATCYWTAIDHPFEQGVTNLPVIYMGYPM